MLYYCIDLDKVSAYLLPSIVAKFEMRFVLNTILAFKLLTIETIIFHSFSLVLRFLTLPTTVERVQDLSLMLTLPF